MEIFLYLNKLSWWTFMEEQPILFSSIIIS